ncbi:hypothetical protein LY622_05870 [Halomonas sp. M5N1S17]|uniref:hypothetical protein n=1 Tax=Halomonas alkalisoli TaxID=2907158 RepID=UPI001F3DC469|nr:hypothetical protein [Halomonas alkalisoli]MCE9662963.1 hypothetical protein [Halomonas alkalisoli]
MSAALCEICGGFGFDRDNHVCIHCAGTGRDPYRKAPGSGGPISPRRNGRAMPLPRSLQAVLLMLALAGGAVSYVSSDGSLEQAGLGALLVLVTGLVIAYALRNLLPLLILSAAFYFIDQALWEGLAVPKVMNAVVAIVIQAYAAVF